MANDLVLLTVEIAFKAYEDGLLTQKQLTHTIERCINAVSIENGYADRFGLPFPEHRFDHSDVETK